MGKTRAKARRNACEKRDFPLREDGQMYARVLRMLGGGRLQAMCDDGTERMCKIRGSMMGRQWVGVGDVVLVSRRDCDDGRADVLFKYQVPEVEQLRKWGEPVTFEPRHRDDDDDIGDDVDIVFEDV